jgi:hypothetical protein
MQISENLAHQLIGYLEGQPDTMAKMLRINCATALNCTEKHSVILKAREHTTLTRFPPCSIHSINSQVHSDFIIL